MSLLRVTDASCPLSLEIGASLRLELGRAYTLGRRRTNDIRIDDKGVAKVHTLLALMPETTSRLIVTDLESTNGTRVDGELASVAFLSSGSTLSIASAATFVFEHEDEEVELDPLRMELEAGPGTFLEALHEGRWEAARFQRLCCQLAAASAETPNRESIPRWLAEGVWTLDTQLGRWVSPTAAATLPAGYLEDALEHVMLLASWLFSGRCPMQSPQDLQRELEALTARLPQAVRG